MKLHKNIDVHLYIVMYHDDHLVVNELHLKKEEEEETKILIHNILIGNFK